MKNIQKEHGRVGLLPGQFFNIISHIRRVPVIYSEWSHNPDSQSSEHTFTQFHETIASRPSGRLLVINFIKSVPTFFHPLLIIVVFLGEIEEVNLVAVLLQRFQQAEQFGPVAGRARMGRCAGNDKNPFIDGGDHVDFFYQFFHSARV